MVAEEGSFYRIEGRVVSGGTLASLLCNQCQDGSQDCSLWRQQP